jgi:hypothetical protein
VVNAAASAATNGIRGNIFLSRQGKRDQVAPQRLVDATESRPD